MRRIRPAIKLMKRITFDAVPHKEDSMMGGRMAAPAPKGLPAMTGVYIIARSGSSSPNTLEAKQFEKGAFLRRNGGKGLKTGPGNAILI